MDYITKPVSPPIVQARVRTQLALYDQNRELECKVRQRTAELNASRYEIIKRLGRAAEFKDNETGMHVVRMSHYSRIIAKAIGMDDQEADMLLNAAPMHDIGKIGIPDRILLKPGKLDEDKWDLMRKHPEFGASIIGEHDSDLLSMARTVALTHHEKWNGKGYPNGMAGEDIPLVGRIVAIADVFDALTTERPYKKAWPVEKAVNLIKEEAGEHFDPKLVEAFLAHLPEVQGKICRNSGVHAVGNACGANRKPRLVWRLQRGGTAIGCPGRAISSVGRSLRGSNTAPFLPPPVRSDKKAAFAAAELMLGWMTAK